MHGYALHSIYGWSVYLIGAIWDSITNLLIHLSHKPTEKENSSIQQPAQELAIIHVDPRTDIETPDVSTTVKISDTHYPRL